MNWPHTILKVLTCLIMMYVNNLLENFLCLSLRLEVEATML